MFSIIYCKGFRMRILVHEVHHTVASACILGKWHFEKGIRRLLCGKNGGSGCQINILFFKCNICTIEWLLDKTYS